MRRGRTDGGPPARGEGRRVLAMLSPSLAVILLLFGGGILLGCVQALGYLPAAGLDRLSLDHFHGILRDPDFLTSLGLTFYIALVSTLVAVALGVGAALLLADLAGRSRWFHFLFQVPLTVPHLVIAVAVIFMASPGGWMSRIAAAVGLVESASAFPLLVNDAHGIGIMAVYVWKEVPFIALMVLAVLKNAGVELIDVGRTLKAGRWQRFRFIVLPLIAPGAGAAGLIVFAFTFGAFEVPYLLGRTHPMTLPVLAYRKYSDVDLMARPEGIAAGLVLAAIAGGAVLLARFLVGIPRRRGGVR